MVDIGLDTENLKITEHGISHDGIQGLGYPREPSFSGWCDEDGVVVPSDIRLHDKDPSTEEFHFELPLPQHGKGHVETETDQQKKIQLESMPMTGAIHRDHVSPRGAKHGNMNFVPSDIEKGSGEEGIILDHRDNVSGYMPMTAAIHRDHVSPRSPKHGNRIPMHLDIEDGPGEENRMLDHRDNGASYGDNFGAPATISKSSVSHFDVLKTLFFILVWYTFSTFLTLYNKSLLGDDLGKFPAPLLMNTVHFTMQAVLSKGIVWFWPQRFQATVSMSWKDYFLRVVPTALGTALDINLSNASLVFISVTFATMCKSAAPIFLLMFAFAFRLESPSYKLLGIIFVISVGVLLTVAKETEFEFWGFVFVMLAAVMSGFRWTMTQILLQKEVYGLKNPLTLMSYVTPVMAVATALLSLVMDPWYEFGNNRYFNGSWSIMRSCLLMLFGGTLAFFMVLTEYILISVTSAVTVTIAGVVKEAVTIMVAVFYFHDEFTWLKGVGLFIIMVGVSLFNWYKYQKLQEGKLGEEDAAKPSAAKYVILDEMDDEDDGQLELSKI